MDVIPRLFLLIAILLGNLNSVLTSFNLYLNSSETNRILGLQGDLYYVRDGVPHSYALHFSLPIPADVNDIFFDWQSLRGPQEPGLLYSIGFAVSNPSAMNLPTTNLKEVGEIPTVKSVFRVTLQCSTQIHLEVNVSIFINVTYPQPSPQNHTNLEIKCTKMCRHYRDLFSNREEDHIETIVRRNSSYYGVPETSSHYFYIGVGSVCGFIIVLALVVAACYMRVKRISYDKQSGMSTINSLSFSEHGYLKVDTISSSVENNKSVARTPEKHQGPPGVMISYGDLRVADAKTTLQEVAIEASSVSIQELFMEGTYGRIFIGQLIGSCEIVERGDVDKKVLIKTISGDASKEQIDDFLRSGCLMKDMPSENLSSLIAACVQEDCRPMLLYSYTDNTNLKKYITSNRVVPSNQNYQGVTREQLIYAAIQIAHGVHYMHKKHIVHKDLGTRNCIINSQLLVKVTDSALSSDLFPSDYDRLESAELRPIRWLAPEAIDSDTHSPSGDTWSFGVTLWELMTLCQLPYEGITSANIVTFLKDGYRLSQPSDCPNEVFAMMACCWCSSPEDRPNFAQLQLCLQDYYATLMQMV